ncbi:MAG: fused MFS/spermidine synthase [Thermoleophilia bacterium]|nr:fused MFS/spermidine synthase [Thermoleophilia bacterium]
MPDALDPPPEAPRARRAPADADTDAHARPVPAGGWLLFVVFVAGAALMAFEIVGSRLLAPTFGSSTYVWGSLISVFLAALASGYSLGGRLADRRPNAATLATLLTCAGILVAATVLLSEPLQGFITDHNPSGTRSNPLIASVLLFGPASVLVGMVSPFAVRLRALDVATVGRTAGSLYGLSTAGSIAGTIAASFWLVQQAGSDATVLIVAGAIAACAVVAAVGGRARARALGFSMVGVVAVLVVWGLGAGGADIGSKFSGASSDYSPVFHAGGYRPEFQPDQSGTLRAQQDSGYHRIRVVDYAAGQFGERPVRVMHFDNSSQAAVPLVQGKPVTAGVPRFGYLRAIDLLPAIRPQARRVLLIGLGSGAAAMRLNELRPDLAIDVVEIDPAVVAVARTWFGYRDASNGNPRITTHVGDGRTWLAAQPDSTSFDAVYIDAYFADSIPFHLTTREFLRLVRSHLAVDGIAAANLIGAVEGSRSELFRSMHRTWAEVFNDIATYPVPAEDGSLDLSTFTNIELIASADRGVLPPRGGEASLVEAADLAVPATTLLDASFMRLLAARYTKSISTSGVPVLTDDRAPVDSLLAVDGI